ncbi:MAG: hypothetical protein IJ105_05645 [Bacilli bacterium]|nr:hypothetical protein [Bacilli bacterium]
MKNTSKLETLIIEYFDYVNSVRNKMRVLNHMIKKESELLDNERKVENEYIEMLRSDCTGKGDYHKIIMLPSDILSQIKSSDLSEEDKKNLLDKYKIAEENAKLINQRYNNLQKTESERLKKIKNYKSNLKKYRSNLRKYAKEYKLNMVKIKKLDQKISK